MNSKPSPVAYSKSWSRRQTHPWSLPIPAALDLSAYRTLQEPVTNTLKHSGTSQIDVRIDHGRIVARQQIQLQLRGNGRAVAVAS